MADATEELAFKIKFKCSGCRVGQRRPRMYGGSGDTFPAIMTHRCLLTAPVPPFLGKTQDGLHCRENPVLMSPEELPHVQWLLVEPGICISMAVG